VAASTPDQGLFLEFVERLLIHPYPEGPTSVDLYPGRAPDDRSIDLPIPAGGRLLGTVVHRRAGDITTVEAVIDVSSAVPITIAAYEEELRQRGWGLSERFHGGGGFVSYGPGPWREYRHGRGGPILMVNAYDRGKDVTDLRLRLDWDLARHRPRHHRPEVMDRMPSLFAPAGVHVEGGGGGGSESHWTTQATAATDMPVSQLEAYFAEQLTRAGWIRLAGGLADVAAWSSWNVPGRGKWRGMLIVLAASDPGERWLTVHIQGPRRHAGGWSRRALSTLSRR